MKNESIMSINRNYSAKTTEQQTPYNKLMASKTAKFPLLAIAILFSIAGIDSCTSKKPQQSEAEITEHITADSLAIELHKLDSVLNSGQLAHLDIYEIGKIKNIAISVQKISTEELSSAWINLRKDCGNAYYYSWENARLLCEECPYLINAIETIRSNNKRTVDHEERYAYITKDNIRISSYAKTGNAWTTELSVDYQRENSSITLSDDNIEELIDLINKGVEKIRTL